MKITVRFKYLPGKLPDLEMDVPNNTKVEEVIDRLKGTFQEVKKTESFLLLVNDILVVDNRELEEGDVLSVFPLLMGG